MTRKPQPWYASLNQPPRSPKDGRNRKPNPPTHRRAPDRTDHSAGANDAADTFAFTISNWTIQISHITDYEPKSPAIPYAGVRAGELIGHRIWLVVEGQLHSLAHRFFWQPETVVEGKLDEVANRYSAWSIVNPIWGGVYSFATYEQLVENELKNIEATRFPRILNMDFSPISIDAVAIGTIKCWGEVIEHERGYRAQYAKLQSIDQVIGCADIDQLRQRYHV